MNVPRVLRRLAAVSAALLAPAACQPVVDVDGLFAGAHPYYPPYPSAVHHLQFQKEFPDSTAYAARYAIPFHLGPLFDQAVERTVEADGSHTYQSLTLFGGPIEFIAIRGVDDDADGTADRLTGTMDLTPVGVGLVDFEMQRYPYFDTYGFQDPFVGCWPSMDEPPGGASNCSPALDTPVCSVTHPAPGQLDLAADLSFVNAHTAVAGGTVAVRWKDGLVNRAADLAIPSSGPLPGGGTATVTLVENPDGTGTIEVDIAGAPDSGGATDFTFRVADAGGSAGPRAGC